MRILISLFFFILSVFTISAKIPNANTCGAAITVVEIHISPINDWERTLYVGVPLGNNLIIDSISDSSAFINNICKQSVYIPSGSITFPQHIYYKYWEFNKTIEDAAIKFSLEFIESQEKYGGKKTFILDDLTKIEFIYLDVFGFFIYGNKELLYPLGDCSSDIDYMSNDLISDIWLIMSVVCCQKTSENFLEINWEQCE